MAWGAIAAALGSSALDVWANNYNAKKQDDRTLGMYRAAPGAQMEGFQRAGLNPMLAYSRMDFPNSAAGYTPSNFSTGVTQAMQASASMESARAATSQAVTSAKQVDVNEKQMHANVQKIEQEVLNLKTDNERAKYLVDYAREQVQNAVKEGYNLTEVGNNLRATYNQILHQSDLVVSQTLINGIRYELERLELQAAQKFEAIGSNVRQLQPLVDLIKSLFPRRYGHP